MDPRMSDVSFQQMVPQNFALISQVAYAVHGFEQEFGTQ